MLLNNLLINSPDYFEKKCKTRIITCCLLILLGAAAIALSFLGSHLPVQYMTGEHQDFIHGFYLGTGMGLIASAVITLIKNVRYLRNIELRKQREIYETDERNRMLGLRCWAFSGYTMLVLLYVGILITGFISITVLKTLLAILVVYALVLVIFKIILQKSM